MPEASYHCAHAGCRCMLNKGQGEFCSDYCRQAAQHPPPMRHARAAIRPVSRKCMQRLKCNQMVERLTEYRRRIKKLTRLRHVGICQRLKALAPDRLPHTLYARCSSRACPSAVMTATRPT